MRITRTRLIPCDHLDTMFAIGLACSTILFALPASQLVANQYQINILASQLLLISSIASIICFIVLYVLSRILQRGIVECFLLWLILVTWLQPQFFSWGGPSLDGAKIAYEHFIKDIFFECLLWFGALAATWMIRVKFGSKGILNAIYFVSFSALLSSGTEVASLDEDQKKLLLAYAPDKSTTADLSSNKNIFIIILDEAQSNIASDLLEREHTLKSKYKDFIFFNNVAGGYQSTIPTIPLIVSGEFYTNDVPYLDYARNAYLSDSSIYNQARIAGYEINVSPGYPATFFPELKIHDNVKPTSISWEDVVSLVDITLFSVVPGPLKQQVYRDGGWFFRKIIHLASTSRSDQIQRARDPDTEWLADFINRADITSSEKKIFYIHLHGAHVAWNLDREGNRVEPAMSIKAYEDILFYKLELLSKFIQKLKALNAYDNSAVIIMGDHGSGRVQAQYLFNDKTEFLARAKARAYPLFMVKSIMADRPELSNNSAALSFQNFHRNFNNLVSDASALGEYTNAVRRYIVYAWEPELKDYFLNYREFIIAGKLTENEAWWPVHKHSPTFPESADCPFEPENEQYNFSRDNISFSSDSIEIEKNIGSYLLVKTRTGSPSTDIAIWHNDHFISKANEDGVFVIKMNAELQRGGILHIKSALSSEIIDAILLTKSSTSSDREY